MSGRGVIRLISEQLAEVLELQRQESQIHRALAARMTTTLNHLEKFMASTSNAIAGIQNTLQQLVVVLGATTTDLKKLLNDQAAKLAELKAQLDSGNAVTADQITALSDAASQALAGVTSLDGAIKAADEQLTAAAQQPAPTPAGTESVAPPAATPTSQADPNAPIVHGVDTSAPASS